MRPIPERDWKVLRKIREDALHRFCVRINNGVCDFVSNADIHGEAHETFLAICRYVMTQNRDLGDLFDDWRRSTAIGTLKLWAEAGIITQEEFAAFSEDTKELIRAMTEVKFYDAGKA